MAEPVLSLLGTRVRDAVRLAFGTDVDVPGNVVLPARDPKHGDYSVTAAMALARTLGQPPFEVAERLAEALDLDGMCETPEVVRPGFVNLRLRPDWLAGRVAGLLEDERAGVEPVAEPERVALDYSAPNVAKQMHVGHLRSTIIGDCLANVFSFLGHDVERINHVGDWGTQFGMLIAYMDEAYPRPDTTVIVDDLGDIEAFYRKANARFTSDEDFKERARQRVVELQAGESEAMHNWRVVTEVSLENNRKVYDLLGVRDLIDRGESFYQPMLADVVADLEAMGLVVVDDGAKCVFVDGYTNKEGDPLPLIVQKADGGYNYATTDLAAIRHRVGEGATKLLYVVAADQSQHLAMVFAVARLAGWADDTVELIHVPFGLVLGPGGKRLRTRTGENVRLVDLLEEAVQRAGAFLVERAEERGEAPPPDADQVARVVGIGAVKYADLSQSRTSNYVFSFDKSLTLKGNTAPYLQYAYVRMRSILRDSSIDPTAAVLLQAPEEVALARRLVELGDVVSRVVEDDAPNHLCAYLYELSQSYNSFYEHCLVLRAEEPARSSRLALCEATARTMRLGLGLLGIAVLERI